MKMKRGSITIFMSIVYVVLFTFTLGMIEAYRVQYLHAKQAKIGRLAIHNLKTEYIKDIMEEYGLLFYKEGLANTNVLKNMTGVSFKSYPDVKVFQDFLQAGGDYYHFPYFVAKEPSIAKQSVPITVDDLLEAKKEALLYAKDRIPFVIAEPLLEKLKIWQKGESAEEWVKKKDNLLKEINQNDTKVVKLYCYLDGVTINTNTHIAVVNELGINHFNRREEEKDKKIAEINLRSDIPAKIKQEMLQKQFDVSGLVDSEKAYFSSAVAIIDEAYGSTEEEKKKDNFIQRAIKELEMNKELSKLKSERNKEYEHLNGMTDRYLNAERTAKEIVDDYKEAIPKIKSLIEEIEDADISLSIKNSLTNELQNVLAQCDMDNNFSRQGNFKYMQEKLTEQKDLFISTIDGLESYRYKTDKLISQYKKAMENGEEWDASAEEEWTRAGEKLFEGEESYFYFMLSYDGYTETASDVSEDALQQKQDDVTNNAPNELAESLDEGDEEVNYERLPSKLIGDINTSQKITVDKGLLAKIEQQLKELGDGIVLNEYYFMVFSHFALKDEDELAFSGYARTDHARKGELEYLLFGDSESNNRLQMIASLFAARIAFNVLALISDPVKMAQVNSMAAAIAGWWSLGIGAAVLSAIIIGLWSVLETSADVFMLFRGKRVPLIKTPTTWYTSVQGGLLNLGLESVDSLAETAEQKLEDGIDWAKNSINQYANDWTTDLRNHMENEVTKQVIEIKSEMDTLKNQINSTVKKGVEGSLLDFEKSSADTKKRLVELGMSEQDAQKLTDKVFSKIEAKRDKLVNAVYTEKVEKIEKGMEKVQTDIEDYLKETQKKAEKGLREKVDEIGNEIKNMGKEAIKKQKESLKKKISDKFAKKTDKPKADSGKIDLRDYIGLNYVDYLRLFMLMDTASENLKWLRALDLIQQNKQQALPNFYLLDCERRFQVAVSSSYEPTFLPFGESGYFGKWVDGKYQVDVVMEGGY